MRQETSYPDEQSTKLAFTCEKPVELSIQIRHPAWSSAGFRISVNGTDSEKPAASSKSGEFAVITREWKTGDTIEVGVPFALRSEGFRDNPRRFAFLHGPLVLSAEVDTRKSIPAIVAEPEQVLPALKPVAGKPSTFTADGAFVIPGEGAAPLTLEPFYKMHGGRHYTVYFDAFTPEQWKVREEQYKAELAKQKELDARTVDHVMPGHDQNERDHKIAGERTSSGDFGQRKYRHATDGGWFSWDVKILPDQPQELRVTYWGSDGGGRTFDILVDGQKLATQKLEHKQPDKFYDEIYPVPAEMLKDKDHVTIKFQAHPGSFAGGVFDVRMMRK